MKPATPADAKACWESMKKPSARTVSAKLKAAGLTASFKTVAKWKREGWPGADNPTAAAVAAKAVAVDAVAVVAAVVTGDPAAQATGLLRVVAGLVPETKNSTLAEDTYREIIQECRMYAAALGANRNVLAEAAPEAAAKAFGALAITVTAAHDGLARVPNLREGEMKDTPGTVEIIPPSLADKISAHPLRASLEAYGKAAKEAAR